ncbi:DNA-directed RNA polymerases II, IV and V subunit 8B-like [Impatiens glandulifera]|uniref:DNA-directed RNA polymerases II, IV and V subunit 8B-like n=1 Tax=Impatiens glandulifera TaxID=253017 RepID=UPI001FB164DE|nr:DNA-directed RNA polymerases II, IV and V subunit 8B-like [Impatiens glandulifera]
MAEPLLQDIFTVERVDADGKKFDRVSRIEARSQQLDIEMQLDINSEIYPLYVGDKFNMVLVPTLNLDGTPDTGYFIQGGRKTLADKFEYVMHGKIYRIPEDAGRSKKVEMLVSFSGLLMQLNVEPGYAQKFDLDMKIFLLIRKV